LCYDLAMNKFEPVWGVPFEQVCRAFELQYHMSSDEFMRRFEAGELGDDAVYFDWYAAKRGLDIRKGKSHATDSSS
jgi:hypothetical protein